MTSSAADSAPDPPRLAPGLHVAATPIGNLRDASFRLLDALAAADVVLCEDTRRTGALCARYGVSATLRPYHEHNAAAARPKILEALRAGAAYCLVSDAGTPLISDPGYKLVAEARDAGVPVYAVPGPCAATAALSVAGLPTDRFFFAGFPPAKQAARRAFLAAIADVPSALVFYEAPGRLAESLADMASAYADRDAAIVRELTKIHETVRRAPIGELAAVANEEARGEIVVVVGPPVATAPSAADVDAFLDEALAGLSVRDAAAVAADALSISKKAAYAAALEAKRRRDGGEG